MEILIEGCKRQDRESQRLLYNHYYNYCYSVCLRYCVSAEEAREVTNDGFVKVFQKIMLYEPSAPFKGWIRKIMINGAIDHYRKESKHYYHKDVDDTPGLAGADSNEALHTLSYQELLLLIKRLPPAYAAVFNLHVIDGYTHPEVAAILGITEGTSKSNLSKAREKLKRMLEKMSDGTYAKSN
jgi:RNA polymerase sigma factor (sigma-70 family)